MNYPITAIGILLNKDCILARYMPLIPLKEKLIAGLLHLGCDTKEKCTLLTDEQLLSIGIPNKEMINLFRRFLVMYDVNPQKFKDIDSLSLSVGEAKAYRELYQLPGVKATRAELYYKAGYTNLFEIASATAEEIIEKTSQVIAAESSNNKAPLLKEARTHVAVARAFTSSI